ncbi:MAG: DPP IV N-terminal domain-containing protein [Candidatus Cloacimonetes bacterium]|nr:DPP IV N-terminal domain-containing protein [Candidatus Cloacimonadota bacterium]MDD5624478.1 S41 family peptidase [Candidatus Cloacimonadota bacterium]
MKRIVILVYLVIMCLSCLGLIPDFASDPAISPDGNQICFVYSNDLWLVPFQGGSAVRLTSTEAKEWGPVWSPDGKMIAFNSDREGSVYPYIIPANGGSATAVIEESYTISEWFNNGQYLLCTRSSLEFGTSFYQVPIDVSRPKLIAEIGDPYATLSPDNSCIVFNRYGYPYREAYQGSMAGDLWKIDLSSKTYTRLTYTPYTERYPRFSYVDDYLYFCASDSERFQIYRVKALDFSKVEQITHLADWSARDISLAHQNDRMVFEYFNEIWRWDPETGIAARVEICIDEDMWIPDLHKEVVNNNIDNFAISSDELLVGFTYKYDTFFIPSKGGKVVQIDTGQTAIGDMEFLDDNRTLVLAKMDKGINKLYAVKCDSLMQITSLDWFGADSLDVERLYKDPSGKWIVFYGDKQMSGKIAVADSNLTNIRPVNNSRAALNIFACDRNGDYGVYVTTREDVWIRELWLYDFNTGESKKIMNDDAWIRSMLWTPDNKSIIISRNNSIYRLDLVPRNEFEYEVDNWEEILNPEAISKAKQTETANENKMLDSLTTTSTDAKSENKELNIVWEGIEKRLYPILLETNRVLSAGKVIDDSTFYYISYAYDDTASYQLKKANIYGKNSKTILNMGRNISNLYWVGNTLYFLENGKLKAYNIDKRSLNDINANFDYSYSESKLNTRVFEQVWGAFGLNFYDPNMHNKNWNEMFQLYYPYAERARSIADIEQIVNEMIGEVNASHTGFYPRPEKTKSRPPQAYLGLELDYYQALDRGIVIKMVYPHTRLADYYQIQSGDTLLAIDGTYITPYSSVDKLLEGKAGKRINLSILQKGKIISAELNGLTWSEQRRLHYNYKIEKNKKLVRELTQDRIGYVHIPAMGNNDYENFRREVFRDNADKEALIIDVRSNSGGHIHDKLISMLNQKYYAYSSSRRYSGKLNPEPRGIWAKPTILLVDEHSFSDGEIFPTVYQELKLGKIVGQPTSGSVIGTWEFRLLDGSSMRMPGSGWYRLDGTNMEGNGVQPDIIVENKPEDIIAGKDAQLLYAIEEILKELH